MQFKCYRQYQLETVRQKCLQKGRYKVLPSFKNTKIRESVTSDNLIDTFLTPLNIVLKPFNKCLSEGIYNHYCIVIFVIDSFHIWVIPLLRRFKDNCLKWAVLRLFG